MAIILPIVSNFNKKGITDATAALSALGDGLKRLGAQVSFAAFMSSSINQARDLQRNIAALEGVFGSYADRMKAFTVDAQGFGLSQTEAARTATFLGSVLKSAGFGMEEVSVQTEKLTMLAQDLATTYGYDTSEALTAMTALFRGEYDPIEKFGVALKQNEINALIAAKGLSHLTGVEMLNAQQQVRMEQLYLRTNDAQGAYARQSDSLFVSQKNLTAAFKNLQANAAQPLTIALGKLFANMAPLIDQAGPGLTQTFTQFADIILTLTPLLNPIAVLISSLSGEFNVLIAALSGLIKPLITPLIQLTYGLTNALNGLFGWVNQNASALIAWSIAIGVIVGAWRTYILVMGVYKAAVMAAAVAQTVLTTAIAVATANPALAAAALAVIAGGITAIALTASNAKFEVEGLNAALNQTGNAKIPKLDFTGGAPVGLDPGKIKNPMDGTTTTWFSGGKWYTAEFKNGKWSAPKEYKAASSGGTKETGTQAKDYVSDFYKNLRDEVEKQSARLKLQNLGASEAFIESIVGSGQEWKKVFDSVAARGKSGVASLQKQFNKTSTGAAEVYKQAEEAAKAAFESAKAVYEEQLRAFEKQRDAINELKKSLKDLTTSTAPLAVATREIGEFEQSTIDSFNNIADTIAEGLANGTLLKSAADSLTAYARSEQTTIQNLMRQRDELVNRRGLAKDLMDDIKATVKGMGNVTELLAKNTTDVTQTITKMVGNVQVATSKVIKGVTGGSAGLVASFTETLAKTKAFAQQLKDLRALGLDSNIYQQIVTAGVDAGGTTAKAILEGGAGTVSELNSLFTELSDVGSSMAEEAAQVMYGSGVDLVDGLINGLISKEKELVDYATQLATAFTTAFNSQLATALPMPNAPVEPVYQAPTMPVEQIQSLRLGDVKLGGYDAKTTALATKLIASPKATAWTTTINVNAGFGTDGKATGQAIYTELLKFAKSNGIKV
jgi:hypothetical protein